MYLVPSGDKTGDKLGTGLGTDFCLKTIGLSIGYLTSKPLPNMVFSTSLPLSSITSVMC